MIRTFLALPLEIEAPLRSTCLKLQDLFINEKLRWVKQENMHLTIRFFGDIEEDLVPVIGDALIVKLGDFQGGIIKIKGLGTFENRSAYNVLWAGIEDTQKLLEIKQIVDQTLEEVLPIKTHRRYRPHLTLARMKRIYHRDRFLEEISKYETTDFGTYALDRLVLYQSILGERGPVYKELKEIKLDRLKS